jgi:hypothetical protein
MPDRDTEQQGHSARLLRALIWTVVGLAPLAAIAVLLGGSGNSVRLAVLLIAVCVVLIGASMLIRSDPVLLRMDVEDRVAAEIDVLREQIRADIAAAARVSHHRVQILQSELVQGQPARMRPEPEMTTGGRVVVPAATSAPPGRAQAGSAAPMVQPGMRAGPAPRQRAAPVPPPMAPVFRPPMGPRSGAPSFGVGPGPGAGPGPGRDIGPDPGYGTGPLRRPAGPPPGGPYGSPRRPEPAYDTAGPGPERGFGYDDPAGPGFDREFRYDDAPGPGPERGFGYDDAPGPAPERDFRYEDAPGPAPERDFHHDHYDDPAVGAAERSSGKRRADGTAIDLGYTGRRSRPNHATDDGDGYDPEENTGYGAPSPDRYGPDPVAEQYDWRQPSDRW